MVYQWIKNTLAQWLPQRCVLCGQGTPHHALCEPCLRDMPRLEQACPQCGLPLVTPNSGRCGHCQQQPPVYDRVISAFAYTTPVSQLVSKLKFRGQLHLARLFGELLAGQIGAGGTKVQAVLPVPLHPRRLRHRGFNQALEIARPIGHSLCLPIVCDAVTRQRDTPPQSAQPAGERARNIRGAFTLNKSVAYARVAIVDDVMTSGHTVSEIAKLLRHSGVEHIEVWCVARAWRHD
jgi:ComF family protein